MPKGKKFIPKKEDEKLFEKINNSEKLKQCYNRLSDRCKINYPLYWIEFFLLIKQDPDKYLIDGDTILNRAKYIQYRKKIETDILTFIDYLKNKEKTPSPATFLQSKSAIYKLLKVFNIKISDNFKDDLTRLTPKNEAVTDPIISTKEEFREIFNRLDTQGKAMFLMQVSSGCRLEELLDIRMEDLELKYKYPRFRIRHDDSKNGKQAKKRCSREAKQWINRYYTEREQWLETKNNRSKGRGNTGIEGTLFPMSKQNAIDKWNNALKKADLNEIDTQSGLHRRISHTLRKYFRKQCKKAGEELFGKWMSNHDRNVDNTYIYDNCDQKEIDEIYSKCEKELLIFETTDTTDENILKLKEQIDKLQREKTIKTEDIEIMNTQFNSLRNRLTDIETLLKQKTNDTIDSFAEYTLTKQQEQYEEKLEKEAIAKKEAKLRANLKPWGEIIYVDKVPFLSINRDKVKDPKSPLKLVNKYEKLYQEEQDRIITAIIEDEERSQIKKHKKTKK